MQNPHHLCLTLLLPLPHLFRRMLQRELPGSLPFLSHPSHSIMIHANWFQFLRFSWKNSRTFAGSGSMYSCRRLWGGSLLRQLPCFGPDSARLHQRPSHHRYISRNLQQHIWHTAQHNITSLTVSFLEHTRRWMVCPSTSTRGSWLIIHSASWMHRLWLEFRDSPFTIKKTLLLTSWGYVSLCLLVL